MKIDIANEFPAHIVSDDNFTSYNNQNAFSLLTFL